MSIFLVLLLLLLFHLLLLQFVRRWTQQKVDAAEAARIGTLCALTAFCVQVGPRCTCVACMAGALAAPRAGDY
jgi:hypothetical protein